MAEKPPEPGAVLSPYQFEDRESSPERSASEVVREIDTLLWGLGCKSFMEFQDSLNSYAADHLDELEFYVGMLDQRKVAVAQMIVVALAARLKLPPEDETKA